MTKQCARHLRRTVPGRTAAGASLRAAPVAAVLLLPALLAACAAASAPTGTGPGSTAGSGLLTGVVRTYGGPEMSGSPAANGILNTGVQVRVTLAGRTVATLITGSDGRFSVRLTPGDYVVDGCASGVPGDPVTVQAGGTTTHDIACQVP